MVAVSCGAQVDSGLTERAGGSECAEGKIPWSCSRGYYLMFRGRRISVGCSGLYFAIDVRHFHAST